MSIMQVFDETGQALSAPLRDDQQISADLADIGIRLEYWDTPRQFQHGAEHEDILAAYQDYIEQLNAEYGFEFVDVSALWPNHPKKKEIRQQFISEHTHLDDEVRFFVDGQGLFYFHIGDKVYLVLCQQGDLISVPSKTTHWFDMGENPDFTLIRFFPTRDGWVAENSGSDIATRLPDMDVFVQSL
jgi:1,2-dihydroxy-3-keto-5-methylthiopentene dioxygenase